MSNLIFYVAGTTFIFGLLYQADFFTLPGEPEPYQIYILAFWLAIISISMQVDSIKNILEKEETEDDPGK